MGFPGVSESKLSACNAGDPCSIPGIGRSPGEGTGYLLQYARASLVAQMNTCLRCRNNGKESACKYRRPGFNSWVGRSLGGGHGNTLQYSCLENPVDRGAWRAIVHGVAKSRTHLSKDTILAKLGQLMCQEATCQDWQSWATWDRSLHCSPAHLWCWGRASAAIYYGTSGWCSSHSIIAMKMKNLVYPSCHQKWGNENT